MAKTTKPAPAKGEWLFVQALPSGSLELYSAEFRRVGSVDTKRPDHPTRLGELVEVRVHEHAPELAVPIKES